MECDRCLGDSWPQGKGGRSRTHSRGQERRGERLDRGKSPGSDRRGGYQHARADRDAWRQRFHKCDDSPPLDSAASGARPAAAEKALRDVCVTAIRAPASPPPRLTGRFQARRMTRCTSFDPTFRRPGNWTVQMWAADALAEIGPAAKAAVPELIACLKSDTRYVVTSSAKALGKIGPDAASAVPALTAQLESADDCYTRVCIARACGASTVRTNRCPCCRMPS